MPKIFYQKGVKITLLGGILVFLVVILSASGVSAGYTFATYNDGYDGKHKKSGHGKGLELTIDSRAVYNGVLQPALTWDLKHLVPGVDHFFDFDDVKPGDMGEHTISLHVKKSAAYACLDFQNLVDDENGMNEPEALVDDEEGGELSQYLEFFGWRDDGDGEFEVGEKVLFGLEDQAASVLLNDTTYPIEDTYTGKSCKMNSVNYVGIIWCAGDLMVDVDTAEVSCSGEGLGNVIQTDSMSVDVRLRAVQSSYNNGFRCSAKSKPKKPKGNNGHGNDEDHNDDSNPGNSNDEDDHTDDDGVPPGQEEEIESERFTRVSDLRRESPSFRNNLWSNLAVLMGRNM
ncbi:MAG: hypothetical protein H6779_05380 [Candidatus Nomurabacteria bacterium]|nr:MAG: hypothetical protein H6779_05380 [Candidatus Nomurabacteria bacterium]